MGQTQNSTHRPLSRIDFKANLNPVLILVCSWKLGQLRQLFINFRRRCRHPFVDRLLFQKITSHALSPESSQQIFNKMSSNRMISFFEVLCVVSLTSFASYIDKVRMLMRFFDFQNHNELSILRFKLILKIMLYAFAKLTSQPFSDFQQVQSAVQEVIAKSDLGLQDSLSFQDTVNWLQSSQMAFQMFKRFQPRVQTPQNFMMLAPFHNMSPSEAQAYSQLISNSYRRLNYQQILNINYPRKRTVSQRSPEHLIRTGRGSSVKQHELRLPTLTDIKRSPQTFKTIKVSTISKKKVIELKDYFDHLANKGRVIRFNEFEEAIAKRNLTASNNVISSLFNFLDQEHEGVISFPQLVKALFPKIKARQLQEINKLSKKLQFSRSGIKPKQNKQTEQMLTFLKKKKELPSRCLKSLRRLFDFFDEGKKGFLNFKDFKKNFCYSYDSKDIEELIRKYDKDGDGKLQFEQFVRMLLPEGFSIEGFAGESE